MTKGSDKDTAKPIPPEPVDISDGIPDRRALISWPLIAVLIVVFVAWCSFLLYCQYEGVA
jgi:hypothetical protein